MSKARTFALLLGFYLFLSLIFTWPLAQNMVTGGFGYDEDSPYHIWHNWWLKYSLFDLKQNPLYTNYIFHPQSINLIYDANAFIFAALTLPIQFLTGNVVLASNLILLLSFALSGTFAYLLAKYLLRNNALSLLCGLIFAFNPYTFAQALDGHTNLTTTWIIPLYTLFLMRALSKNPSDSKFEIAAGVTAALQLYNDFTYTAFLIVETALIFIFFLFTNLYYKLNNDGQKYQWYVPLVYLPSVLKPLFIKGVVMANTALIISAPILFEVARATKGDLRASSPLWVQNVWSADLLTFVRPNDHSTFLKNPWTPNIGTVEGTAFLGYTLIFLTALYLLARVAKRIRAGVEENLILFLAISFFILMLGPSIHYKNNFQFNFFGEPFIFPLPYLLLHKMPFVGETQEPGRMFPFLILPLSILVSLSIDRLSKLLSSKLFFHYLILGTGFLLITLEYLTTPFPTTDLTTKPIFDLIRKDPENKAVLVLPLGFNSGNFALGHSPIGSLQFYQAYFQKPSFRGTVARLPYSAFEYYEKIPLIMYLIDPKRPLIRESVDWEKQQELFRERLNIKYIVVMESKYKGPIGQTYEVIENLPGAKKFYDQGGVRGYIL